MRLTKMLTHALGWLGCLILISILGACAGKTSYVGRTATQEQRVVLLEEGPHEGIWETNDIILNYAYTKRSASLGINGTVKLSSGLSTGYTAIESFRVRINFLDDQQTVLASQILYRGGQRVPIRTWKYAKQFDVPAGAVAFNVSYAGTVLDLSSTGDRGLTGGGVSWAFWRHP